MKIHREFEQHSLEWMQARAGIPTASDFDQLLTPEFKIRTGEMPKTYLNKKLAEAWTGEAVETFQSFAMEQGNILEDEAKPWYALEFSEPVESVGFITTDDGRVGCSPDGLISEGGIEIKCPAIHTHVGYLLNGDLPKDYACQVHGSMYVTGAPWWKFLSYRRRMPPLVLTIFRDETIQKAIGEALAGFLARFDESMARLVEMNGGPPQRKPRFVPSKMEQEPVFDVIP
jgi:hypothetical protein